MNKESKTIIEGVKMTKAEKIYNALKIVGEKGTTIYSYLFIYGFAICFIIVGITLILTPANPEYAKWFFLLTGLSFFMVGCSLLFMAIKYSLQRYLEKHL